MPDARKGRRLAVGLMSGTSMDAVDAALVEISGPSERPRVRWLALARRRYPAPLRERLLRVASGEPASSAEISELNFTLGEIFARAALEVCRRAGTSPRRLAVIGSHGQTIYHQGLASKGNPRAPGSCASTLQIAEPAVIAVRTGTPVVADFRTADIAAGGQGAPLVPMTDYLLLRDGRQGTVALNIGGISNVTVIPRRAKLAEVFGFDTGPGNMVMDGLVRHFTKGRQHYDAGGRWARKGRVIERVLSDALAFPFFRLSPPKTAGREQFGSAFLKRHFLRARRPVPYGTGRRPRPEDLLRTACELTARSIAEALRRFVFPRADVHRLVVSGGGAHNLFLIRRIVELLPELAVHSSDRYGLPVGAKEAIAFALLADRTLRGLPGNIPAVTGARRPVVLGKLVRP